MATTYTLREASVLSGFSELTLRRKIKNGTLKAEWQGNKYLIQKENIPEAKKFIIKKTIPALKEHEQPCECACNLCCGHDHGPSPSGMLRLHDAEIIAKHFYMLYGYHMARTKKIATMGSNLFNEPVQLALGLLKEMGVEPSEIDDEDKIIVSLMRNPRKAVELYNLLFRVSRAAYHREDDTQVLP